MRDSQLLTSERPVPIRAAAIGGEAVAIPRGGVEVCQTRVTDPVDRLLESLLLRFDGFRHCRVHVHGTTPHAKRLCRS